MPASKKRIQKRGNAFTGQQVPAALREWVHIWHGVRVRTRSSTTATAAPTASTDPSMDGNVSREPACYVDIENGCSVATSTAIFHSGSRMEELSFWKQLIRLPSNSLFPSVATIANPRRPYKDFLYVLLNMRWPTLFLVLMSVFVGIIALFAVLVHWFCGDPPTLLRAFNLSYQTFSSIGFGIVYPTTTCSNVVMVVESFASMLVTSAITGLVFAKFAKPKAKIAFSKVCVIQPYGKQYLALVVRVANATQSKDITHDVIMEANFKLNLLRIEQKQVDAQCQHTTRDVLCSYNLKLLQQNFITFRMGIAVVHVIDETSPLFGMTDTDILGADMILEVAMSGVDSTLQDTVSERYTYTAEDFRWGYRFAELLEFDECQSEVIMDFSKLSTIERALIDMPRYVRSRVVNEQAAKEQTRDDDARRRTRSDRAVLDSDGTTSISSRESISSSSRRGKRVDDEHGRVLAADDAVETLLRVDHRTMDEGRGSGADLPLRAHSLTRRESSNSEDATHALKRSMAAPHKFSMGMEPLFEPLLQAPVGTQRVHHATGGGGAGGGAHEIPLLRALRIPSGAGAAQDHEVDGVATPGNELLFATLQQKRLQEQLAGECGTDMDTDGQADDDQDSESNEEDDASDGDDEEEEVGANHDWARRSCSESLRRQRSRIANQSVASVDVQDTPRFLKIAPVNIPKSYDFMRLYNSALYQRWPRIILVFVLLFISLNVTFAFLYWLRAHEIEVYPDVVGKSYELAFYMSVHTFATIGYGSIAPNPDRVYMNFWVFVETSLGIIAVTIITGIAWSKFARPRAHIHFSSRIVITTIYGHRCLVFRAANTRHSGDVHENFFRIGVILTNRKTGLRQLYDVPLVTAEWPSIKLPATLIHIIDKSSPFYRFERLEDLQASRVAVIALLTGLDTTFSENVYARKMYFCDDFAFNMRFADFATIERDRVTVAFDKFDEVEAEQMYTAPRFVEHPPAAL